MTPPTTRNLFRYPLFLTPEAYFLVCRHELTYATLIPLWLQARGMLPRDIVVHGITASYNQTAVTLLCEVPLEFPGHWARVKHTGDVLDCCSIKDFCITPDDMPEISAFIQTRPHQRYIESGPLSDVLDAETMRLLIEKEGDRDARE